VRVLAPLRPAPPRRDHLSLVAGILTGPA